MKNGTAGFYNDNDQVEKEEERKNLKTTTNGAFALAVMLYPEDDEPPESGCRAMTAATDVSLSSSSWSSWTTSFGTMATTTATITTTRTMISARDDKLSLLCRLFDSKLPKPPSMSRMMLLPGCVYQSNVPLCRARVARGRCIIKPT
jgi:hypothetical protein